ncbi:MAG: HlyD family efflux transporter periplasmic adaptor subunit [Zoogloea sp.]|nr:HlyD family efflux transporter periplasmic adaptor subunit [Zoogloea sp.]
MNDDSLFRTEALEAQRTNWLGPVVLAQPLSFAVFALVAALCGAALIAFFALGSYTKRTTVPGQLLPAGGWSKVYPREAGVVIEKRVQEGQTVRQGDVLYVLSLDRRSDTVSSGLAGISEQVTARRNSLRAELGKTESLQVEQRANLQRKEAAFDAELRVIAQSIDGQKSRVALAEDTLRRYKGLLDKDYIAAEQVQLREADLIDQRSRLQALERDRLNVQRELTLLRGELTRLPLEQSKQISELRRGLSSTDQELVESELRRQVLVVAPRDGVATAVTAEVGHSVDGSRPVVSIVPPGGRLQAYLFAPSKAVGFVREGDRVMIRLDPYPYQKFGHLPGRVAQVARVSLSSQELSALGLMSETASAEPVYRITADLDAQTIQAYGEARPLQVGMQLQADIMQERRKLYEWVLEPLISITGKL